MKDDIVFNTKLGKILSKAAMNFSPDYFNDDITFCGSPCDNTSCFRHPSNCKHPELPHSVSVFMGTGICPLSTLGRGYEVKK